MHTGQEPTNYRNGLERKLRALASSLYAIAVILVLFVINYPQLHLASSRVGANLIILGAVISIVLIYLVPWDSLPRSLFLLMPLSSISLLAGLVYLTGGEHSPFQPLYMLPVVFAALYYELTSALLIGLMVVIAAFTPMIYSDVSSRGLVEQAVLSVASLGATAIGALMKGEIIRLRHREQILRNNLEDVWTRSRQLQRETELERRRRIQLEAVHAVGQDVLAVISPENVPDVVVGAIHRNLGYDAVILALTTEDSSELSIVASYRTDGKKTVHGNINAHPLINRSIQERKSVYSNDLLQEKGVGGVACLRARSMAVIPIIIDDRPGGVLIIESRMENAFDTSAITALESIADYVSLALRNAEWYRQLSEKASRDPLSGFLNHRAFVERVAEEIERSRRLYTGLSILFFDLDHFKQVNDTFGHEVGNKVLKEMSRVARQTLRSIDVLGRFGGEEFEAILPGASIDDSKAAAERLRSAISGHQVVLEDGRTITLQVSVGAATYPFDGATPEELIRNADAALYEAKRRGRNKVVHYADMRQDPQLEPMGAY